MLFRSGLAGATAFLAGPMAGCASLQAQGPLLGFTAVPSGTADAVTVPPGYRAQAFAPWGTPLFSAGAGSVWRGDGSENAQDQARQVGDNHDGMHFFPMNGTSNHEGLLVMNHEYNTVIKGQYTTLFGSPRPASSAEHVDKAIQIGRAHV